MGFGRTQSRSYYHMNNSLPTAQWTTLTDLCWPQAGLRGTGLLMGYKEGSVCRLLAPFPLCTALLRLALLSMCSNIYFTGGSTERQRGLLARTYVHTSSQQAGHKHRKIHEIKTLMYTHTHAHEHTHAHTKTWTHFQLRERHAVHLKDHPPPKADLFIFLLHVLLTENTKNVTAV